VRETNRGKLLLLSIFLLVFVGVAILSGGLSSLRFQPGKPFPQGASTAPPEVGDTGHNLQPAWLAEAFQRILYATVLLLVAVSVIGAIVSPQFRRFLLRQLPPILIIFLLIALFSVLFHPERVKPPPSQPPASAAPPAAGSAPEYVPPVVNPPNWSVVLIALGAAGGMVGLGFAAWWRFRRREPAPGEQDVLAELGTEAGAAAARIRHGEEPRDVVIRAYKEMCEILSRRVENPDYLTPREFARRLRARGMRDEHVDRLTGIFEEVRYGHREGTRFAGDAVSCLEEIRDAYAQG